MKYFAYAGALFRLSIFLPAVLSAAVAITNVPSDIISSGSGDIFTINDLDLRVATRPISAKIIGSMSSPRSTSLTKRGTYNGCFDGTVFQCMNGLSGSGSPDPPAASDCTQLASAIKTLAESQVTGIFPCHYYGSSSCPSFTVPPQYERIYTIGTCQVALANLNPVGGNDVQYCDYLIAGTFPGLYTQCTGQGFTGGVSLPFSNPQFALIVAHT